jgi:SAM-dependent methyltransferase
LYALGLRQDHRLLDVGCGSLRAGRLLIAYLEPGHYFGVEPNTWLVDEAVKGQVGKDLVDIKRPTFKATDRFDFSGLGEFDFVLVHGSPPTQALRSCRSCCGQSAPPSHRGAYAR